MTSLKTCSVCLNSKPPSEFYKRNGTPDGVRKDCKDCCRERSLRNHYADRENKNKRKNELYRLKVEKNPSFHAELYAKNREYVLAKGSEYYRKNPERYKERARKWAQENRGKSNAIKKAYKAAKLKSCPPWVRNDSNLRAQMDEIYERAYTASVETGTPHHVDHIIPLRGKSVSGLHVPWNLQILTASENCSKSNKLLEEV